MPVSPLPRGRPAQILARLEGMSKGRTSRRSRAVHPCRCWSRGVSAGPTMVQSGRIPALLFAAKVANISYRAHFIRGRQCYLIHGSLLSISRCCVLFSHLPLLAVSLFGLPFLSPVMWMVVVLLLSTMLRYGTRCRAFLKKTHLGVGARFLISRLFGQLTNFYCVPRVART